ncbi:MAG: 5'-3' exonuclease H3TH domain-containing protein [Candidatus Beckwithbacteria bacterium]|nr:hypothetical protein [Patescibacteria group bacterium]
MRKRLVLIDGHAIVYRAYYAFPPTLKTKSGEQANAVYGFLSILLSVVKELKPSHIAVAFDMGKPTFRHLEFADYKAQRPETDKELIDQIGMVKDSVKALNMPIFGVEGFEADDVIGTLAKQSYDKKIEAMIVTGDQDAMQLVNGNVKVYVPARGRFPAMIYGTREVKERYGFTPKQMIDYKALCGDPSDNIPGIKGIGPKTAVGLIEKFGGVEGVYKRIAGGIRPLNNEKKLKSKGYSPLTAINSDVEGISKSVMEKLINGYEEAMKSKMLATIILDVPITLKLKKCVLCDYDKSKAISFLEELGFYSIIKRLPSDSWADKAEEIFTEKPGIHRVKSAKNKKSKGYSPLTAINNSQIGLFS